MENRKLELANKMLTTACEVRKAILNGEDERELLTDLRVYIDSIDLEVKK